jgi:hypothetical protein
VPAHRLGGDLGQPMPSTMLGVPVKYWAMNWVFSPTASKICAPQ